MKSKTTTAVLLSLLAVAGLAVNDAYAQSNTDRLISINENAESIKGTVEGIADDTDALSTMVSAIKDALSGIADTLTNIMNAITGVQTSVNGVAMDVTQINSKIDGIEMTLMGLSGLDDRLAGIDSRINSLQASMSDDGMDDQILQVLTSTVTNTNDRLEQVINKLNAIEVGLESANIRIAEIETTPATPRPGNILLSGESELNVNSYHYRQYGDPTTDRGSHFYELELSFSCNNDVFIESVELFLDPTNSNPYDYMSRYIDTYPTGDPLTALLNNYVKVDGRDLYNNKLPVGGGNYAEFHRTAEFNNQQLRAGDILEFESLLYEGVFVRDTGVFAPDNEQLIPPAALADANEYLIHNSNRTDNRDPPNDNNALYEINIDWFSYTSGTTCSLSFGSGSTAGPGLTKSTTLSYGVTTDPTHDDGDVILRYDDTIDCGGNPVQITDITAGTGVEWKLASFSKVFLTVGSDEYELKFDAEDEQPVFENLDEILPLHVGGEDLTISGRIAVENLLLTLHYNTIPNAECTVEPGY